MTVRLAVDAPRAVDALVLTINTVTARAGLLRELADVLRIYPGNQRVIARLQTSDGVQRYEFGNVFNVDAYDPELRVDVQALGFLVSEIA